VELAVQEAGLDLERKSWCLIERSRKQLLSRRRERLARPELRPADAVPVEMLLFNYPIQHPGAAPDDPGDQT